MKWRCHPLVWVGNLALCAGAIVFNLTFLFDSIENGWAMGIVASLLMCLLLLFHLLTMPYKVEINGDVLRIIWPWNKRILQRKQVRRIGLKQHWLKTVYIIIIQKRFALYNVIPILLIWEFESGAAPNIASAIQSWWTDSDSPETAILTNEEVSLRRMWTRSEKPEKTS